MTLLHASIALRRGALVLLPVLAALVGGCEHQQPAVAFDTTYQAVLLSGGDAFFGKLEGYGTPNPVLTDVYYVQRQADPQQKQVRNVLLKRGAEWHAPDRMYLNPAHILFVEPVGEGSTVAKLIAQEKSGAGKPAPETGGGPAPENPAPPAKAPEADGNES